MSRGRELNSLPAMQDFSGLFVRVLDSLFDTRKRFGSIRESSANDLATEVVRGYVLRCALTLFFKLSS